MWFNPIKDLYNGHSQWFKFTCAGALVMLERKGTMFTTEAITSYETETRLVQTNNERISNDEAFNLTQKRSE